jgi:hypothetical protein
MNNPPLSKNNMPTLASRRIPRNKQVRYNIGKTLRIGTTIPNRILISDGKTTKFMTGLNRSSHHRKHIKNATAKADREAVHGEPPE